MPNSSDSPNQDMNQLLRKMEMQAMQMQLEVQFNQNMALFKELSPEIYNEYINYQPEELRLSYDIDGHLNLVNHKLHDKPVYSRDPKQFSQDQVDAYISRPSMTSISFVESEILNESHIHVRLINDLLKATQEYIPDTQPNSSAPIGIMLMTGCGLGYQIPMLLEKTDIHNLVIFDPHKDSFYASLHVIDWKNILQYFFQPGRMIKFLVGVTAKDAMANIKLLTDRIGLHNIVFTHMFRHFSSTKEEEFMELYKREFHLSATGTGFFDDEQVSLSHTVNNLNNRIPMFRHENGGKGLPPAFIIGNGPSLDTHIEFIKQHSGNAVIFSAGTALGSLAKVGIKPDFQVEMERNINIKDWIERGTSKEFRKGITLLCLNTAAPGAIELFDTACMAKKPNDIGEVIINKAMQGKNINNLSLCNPTVTNAALSYALSMGFKEIIFFGVDLGTRPDGAHHSSLSLYNEIEPGVSDEDANVFNYSKSKYEIAGNFGGKVHTNPFLDSTRVHMEILLRHTARTLGDVRCFNPNDGAFIDGVEPIQPADLTIKELSIDKAKLIADIRNRHFIVPESETITEEAIKKDYLTNFFETLKNIDLPEHIDSPEVLYTSMRTIYQKIANLSTSDPVTTMLLRGSINGYFTIIMKACYFQPDKTRFIEAYQKGRTTYQAFLAEVYTFMQEQPLKLDDTYDNIITQLKPKVTQ